MNLISVIMPYYKKKSFIQDAVCSALNQTYKNIEIIIIYDDVNLTDPTAIVMGTEGKGIRQLIKKTCDQLVTI